MAEIDFTSLHSIFAYKNGKLFRKLKSKGCKVGEKAGHIRTDGYNQVSINGKNYLLHRIIFFMFYGYMPKKIDHIDNNPSNNCIENLRCASNNQNGQNSKLSKLNKSGFKGVSWHKNSWRVQISANNKNKHIGYFKDLELADLVAQEARNKYHKEFARNK
jgi:hypothetical protein